MRLISVNVGRPREVEWQGTTVRTSIFKSPVSGPVHVGRLDLEGDEQSDLTVHGGAEKAVYAYPWEHYASWRAELPGADLAFGAFGENLTTEGLLESTTAIGDVLRIGTAECVVTQPRMPCFKLGIRFGDPDMVPRFLESGRNGFYLSVSREGMVSAGDTITRVSRGAGAMSVADIVRLHRTRPGDPERLRRAIALPALAQVWRETFRKRLMEAEASRVDPKAAR